MISIIMPTYNRAQFLPTRIAEFMVQTHQDWELIIVDDCSTDNTQDVIESFEDDRIHYIRLDKNSGSVTVPRNVGILQAKGDYIYHADDDDIHHPNALKHLYDALQNAPDKYLSYGDRYKTYQGNTTIECKPDWDPTQPQGWGVSTGQFLYRSSVLDKIPLVFCKRGCDYETCKQIRMVSEFIYVPEIIITMNWHGGNRSLDDNTKTNPVDWDYYLPLFKGRNYIII